MYNDELLKKIDSYIDGGLCYEITLLDNRCVIVEGHRGIKKYDTDSIILRTRNNYILITGKNLVIKEINDRDAVIVGDVDSVRLKDE